MSNMVGLEALDSQMLQVVVQAVAWRRASEYIDRARHHGHLLGIVAAESFVPPRATVQSVDLDGLRACDAEEIGRFEAAWNAHRESRAETAASRVGDVGCNWHRYEMPAKITLSGIGGRGFKTPLSLSVKHYVFVVEERYRSRHRSFGRSMLEFGQRFGVSGHILSDQDDRYGFHLVDGHQRRALEPWPTDGDGSDWLVNAFQSLADHEMVRRLHLQSVDLQAVINSTSRASRRLDAARKRIAGEKEIQH